MILTKSNEKAIALLNKTRGEVGISEENPYVFSVPTTDLEERELEMLASYMGHDIKVHREYYRLPEDTLQLAKCGKSVNFLGP
ncbi:uncharacterized protein LOC130628930 [Hydractinia symbiolongicarpus]|uniref:uncharacterized protein LOC130628930 n=1 Tax=Hydractinia symbiolongicarpus TaxID=13093 RepID=UPI00254F172E|nr:uncharacterized protein LOC130628930 [Hydractinia symbiolongicarpus]